MWALSDGIARARRRRMAGLPGREEPRLRLAPFSGFDIELNFPFGPHPHQQVLQRVGAFAARIDPLLKGIYSQRLFKGGQYLIFVRHSMLVCWGDELRGASQAAEHLAKASERYQCKSYFFAAALACA